MYRKRANCPKHTATQLRKIPKLSRFLLRHYCNEDIDIVMDDEKYFLLQCDEIAGNSSFYTENVGECPNSVKYEHKTKFPAKIH